VAHVLAADITGVVNGVAPGAARQRDFARALGRALRRPAILPAPAWALRIGLGRFASELLASQRATPRAAQASGYGFVHAELAEALRAALGEPRPDGA